VQEDFLFKAVTHVPPTIENGDATDVAKPLRLDDVALLIVITRFAVLLTKTDPKLKVPVR
jgi:hypothetical protein